MLAVGFEPTHSHSVVIYTIGLAQGLNHLAPEDWFHTVIHERQGKYLSLPQFSCIKTSSIISGSHELPPKPDLT